MKKANLSINKLIIIILAILILLAVLILIFKPDILEWIRNLPQYNYGEDRVIEHVGLDEEILAGQCDKGGEIIATVGNPRPGIVTGDLDGKYLYYNMRNLGDDGKIRYAMTQLYWKENPSRIILKERNDILIAQVTENAVKVEKPLLDLNSEIWQRIRFDSEIPLEYRLFPELDNSYLGKGNVICKAVPDTELIAAWPENTDTEIISIHLSVREKKVIKSAPDWLSRSFPSLYKNTVSFSPYISIDESELEYLYLVNKGSYLEIKGYEGYGSALGEVGRIYPDGSLWVNKEVLIEKGKAKLSTEVKGHDNKYYFPYYETNIRSDNYENLYIVTK